MFNQTTVDMVVQPTLNPIQYLLTELEPWLMILFIGTVYRNVLIYKILF